MGSSEGVEMRTALAASQINALFGMPKVIYADFVCAANVLRLQLTSTSVVSCIHAILSSLAVRLFQRPGQT